ncbi:MAG: GNAT family N-acetyltransferase [Brachymonas sp.]|nr:GNAT family N-acetyltransferase [Brachymonas sp.]
MQPQQSAHMAATPPFVCKAFDQLSVHELLALLVLRQQVFVVEQNCPYPDADALDAHCWHLFALDEAGHALATCRLIPAGQQARQDHAQAATAAIGRLAVIQQARGRGMGRALMQEALRQLAQLSPGPVRIAAQQHLQGFYESLGFAAIGSPYLEDNIPHLNMLKH